MHLYTVLLDYAGGTYVSQVTAVDEYDALRRWLDNLGNKCAEEGLAAEIAAAFGHTPHEPVLLEGLANAWCATATAKGGAALANIVRTSC
jgi:hypothetical protein